MMHVNHTHHCEAVESTLGSAGSGWLSLASPSAVENSSLGEAQGLCYRAQRTQVEAKRDRPAAQSSPDWPDRSAHCYTAGRWLLYPDTRDLPAIAPSCHGGTWNRTHGTARLPQTVAGAERRGLKKLEIGPQASAPPHRSDHDQ